MNLNISYNWLKEYVKTDLSAKDFAAQISLSGPSVDRVTEIRPNFEQVVVGEIIEINNHPDADKLKLCKVNIGKEILDIVCGAPNIAVGQKVPVVLVGGRVGNIKVTQAKIRGVDSYGMMCSQRELGLAEDHSGIYILPSYTKVGLALEKVMPIEDEIFDFEVTSNRPDAMSIVGLAREASAILDKKLLYQEPKPNLTPKEETKLTISVKESKLCPRYQAVVMTGVKVDDSPLWMQQRLLASGLRPINNLVDITNYILLEFGQPMHVFDYELLAGQEINVRLAKKGETILALDGKNYELTNDDLVIADNKNPVAVAGVMGGELSAATKNTKTIILESANFDPVNIRRTARLLNLHSDSSNLFEKGLSPQNTYPALMRAVELVTELANGSVASQVFDEKNFKDKELNIELDIKQVNKILGIELSDKEIKNILNRLGFEINDAKKMSVVVPWWRGLDVEGQHDLIEEIARIYGYHKLPINLPAKQIPVAYQEKNTFVFEDKIKNILWGLGQTEVYTYSFISEKQIKDCGLNPEEHIKITNPLNLDFEYLRTSLIPGLLQVVADNENNYKTISVFELSRIFIKQDKNDLPQEEASLAIILAVDDEFNVAFSNLKGMIQVLMNRINCSDLNFNEVKNIQPYWQTGKILEIKIKDEQVGVLGVINQDTLHLNGIKKSSVLAVELSVEKLLNNSQVGPTYHPLPKFPAIELDISMEIKKDVYYRDVVESIISINPLIKSVEFLSEYRGQGVGDSNKALAVRVVYRHEEKTLELGEIQKIHNKVVEKLKKEYNVIIR